MKGNYFLAVEAELEAYDRVKKAFSGLIEGRWTLEKNLHATLYFFGTRFAQRELIEQLNGLDFAVEPSCITGLGYFGKHKILYAQSENPSLASLHNRIAAVFGDAQHEFIPHITLMRAKKVPDYDALFKAIEQYRTKELGSLRTSVTLIKSTRLSEGAKYRVVKRFSR